MEGYKAGLIKQHRGEEEMKWRPDAKEEEEEEERERRSWRRLWLTMRWRSSGGLRQKHRHNGTTHSIFSVGEMLMALCAVILTESGF